MFKKRWFNVVVSDEGFSVKTLGRIGVKYTEGSKSMYIATEFNALRSSADITLFVDSIQSWDSPHNDEIINDAKRETIVDNVCRALQFRGLKVRVY